MSEAWARNLTAVELRKFAGEELQDINLLVTKTPFLTELTRRVEDLAIKADQLDALLEDTSFANANEVDVYLDNVRDVAGEFGCDDINELEVELKQLKETMTEFDMADVNDLCSELKRLKKLAQRLEEACIEAAIEVTF